MKAAALACILLWFAVFAYAGYRLSARSFAWIDEPNFGLPPRSAVPLERTSLPPEALERIKRLSPKEMACIRAALPAERLSAALRGDLRPEEMAAIQNCLP